MCRMLIILLSSLMMIGQSSAEAGILERLAMGNSTKTCGPCVRVLVLHDVKEADLSVVGKYVILDPVKHKVISRRVHGKARPIEAVHSGLKWGEEFPDIAAVKIVPTSPDTRILVNGVPYSGIIAIYDLGQKVSIVNEVDIEDYVFSVLASKVDRPVPKEALAAIAIAQRTNAYYRSTFSQNSYWDIDGTKTEYRGMAAQTMSAPAVEAVDSTSYMVMNLPAAKKKATVGQSWQVGLFPASWEVETDAPKVKGKPTLVLSEAESSASQGQNAAQILSKTFPGITIERMFPVY
ncbi:MAG: SpoIID/LytB domain-containing protein [Chlamydiales bacterium]|nr:SpoIID/LytB domain-containing protein [Chlamydiales bacterium]